MKIWTEEKLIEEGYDIRNAQIEGAELTMENCGCISLDVVVEGAGAAVTGDRKLKIIGNIINDKWFDIESFFKDAQENDNKVSEGSNK